MAEVKLTASQQAAIDNRGGALLVSAAAGSGKTKVLVERLMRMVCDPIHPQNINEFLIITYTNAAAAELRGKISMELSRRLAEQPENRHLQRQLSLVYLAEISTVHAFCANLLRTYAHALDLAPDFRVAEESEAQLLRMRCLDQILDDAYAQLQDNEALRAAVDLFGYGRDDHGLSAAVQTIYQAAQCHPYPARWLEKCRNVLKLSQYHSCLETPWGASLLERFQCFLSEQIAAMEAAVAQMQGIDALEKSYVPCFQENLDLLRRLAGLRDWDQLAEKIPAGFGRIRAVRNFEDKQLLAKWKAIRSRCLDGLRDWKEVFYGNSDEVMADLACSADALCGILELVERFTKTFSQEKRRRRLMDFGDLEHEAIRLLTDSSTGRPTSTAREIAGRYAEILVDEYQDSNEVQEQIFAAISQDGRNRFMVGDVKQSIYRFRLADPSIFLKKYRSYAAASEAAAGEPRKIILSDNFRSRPEILAAVNDVFSTVMSEQVGDLPYGADEALQAGLAYEPLNQPVVELHCMVPSLGDNDVVEKGKTEASFVADRVVRLLAEGTVEGLEGPRKVKPEDIVILLRSVNSAAPDYVAALRARGVPCACDRGESLLDTLEVEVMLSILQVIDNPRQDIPLVSALSSPVFQFTAEDLAEIRAERRSGPFYDAMVQHARQHEKSRQFLEFLQIIREESKWSSLQGLLQLVYADTKIEAIFGAMPDGERRRSNLQAFFAFAVEYAAEGHPTLMQFLSDLEHRKQQGIAVQRSEPQQESAVQIMSIHKSKGLEFPIVILADLSRRFNTEDLRQQIVTHPELYAASNIIDWENGVRFPTIAKKAIALQLRQESLSEELRVLYVGMTRAKCRLIMTYCSKFLCTELESIAAEAARPVAPAFSARAKNPGWWILMTAMCRSEAGELFAAGGYPAEASVSDYPWEIRFHEAVQTAYLPKGAVQPKPDELRLPPEYRILERMAFQYPYLYASRIPSKVTATQMKGRNVDEEALEDGVEVLPRRHKALRRPDFVMENRGLTPAEKGTANHRFLQFASYEACETLAGVKGELQRMVEQEFLTAEQADAVSCEQMVQLFQSDLGRRIQLAQHVVREMKFSILADAAIYDTSASGEQVMLQGVVDCMLVEPEGLVIIDFKTDAVSPGGEWKRAEYYKGQLEIYAKALSRIYGKPVKHRILYFLTTGHAVEL